MKFTEGRPIAMTWRTIHRRVRPVEAQTFWFVGLVVGLILGYVAGVKP